MQPWSPCVLAAGLVAVKAHKEYRATIGDVVLLSIPAAICHLFDSESGERIGS